MTDSLDHSISQTATQSSFQPFTEPSTEVGMILQLADGRIQACNAAAQKLLGLTAEQIRDNLFRSDRWQILQPKDAPVLAESNPAKKALQTGKGYGVSMAFCQPSGSWLDLDLTLEPLFNTASTTPTTPLLQENSAAPYAVLITLTRSSQSFHSVASQPIGSTLSQADAQIEQLADQPAQPVNQPKINCSSPSRSTSDQLLATLESISDAFFSLDRDWRFTYVNSQAVKTLNRSAAHLLGKNHWEEFPDTVGTIVEQEYRRALTDRVTVSFEIFYPPLNGWFGVRAYPILLEGDAGAEPSGLAVYFQNVTEQKLAATAFLQQEQTAQQRLAEIEAIYATAPVGLCFNDTDLRYVRINEQLAQINGASVEQHLGQTIRELLPELADQLEPIYRQVIETGQPILNLEVTGMNPAQPGVSRTWLSSYYPLRGNDDRVLGVNVVVQEITEQKQLQAERKRANAALHQSEERYRTLFESIDEGFCILELLFDANDRPLDYRFLEVNPRFEQQTGLREAAGKTILELVPGIEHHWIEIYGRIALTGEALRFEEHSEVMNRWFDAYAFRVDHPENRRVALLFKDITERKRNEATLQESETRFRRMTDILPQIMWTADPDGTIDYYNQYWEDYTGASRVGTDDWEWRDIIYPEDVPRTIECWTQAFTLKLPLHECEHRVRRKDGEYRWHLTRAVPYRNEQGQIIKWFGMAIDTHEQTLAIEAIERYAQQTDRLLQQEQAARAEAERANRVKDEFLAVLSHELRSPLNPILGWSKLLQSGRLNPQKTAEGLEAIERNAKLQTQLIDDLLDISRIMRGKLAFKHEPTDLATVITAAAETVQLAAEAKQIQLNLQITSHVGLVSGDAGRLQQVLWNLLSNAVKFTPSGGRVVVRLEQVEQGGVGEWVSGWVSEQGSRGTGEEQERPENSKTANHPSSPHPLTPSPTLPPNFALITITDTGKGISPNFLPHLFDYFRQEDGSITRRFGGLGLGLAIARQIVEMHGGTISAASVGENQGATFMVRLPLMKQAGLESDAPRQQSTQETDRPPIPLSPHSPTAPLAGVRVLVVDDDADTRELLSFLLVNSGAIVTTASSAEEAIQAIEQSLPDVLLSDIGMPDTDGYALMRSIRQTYSEQTLPAIALTAYAREYDRQQALQVGFQQHIPKPINPETVITNIINLLHPKP